MNRRSQRDEAEQVEPDRIGKMHGRRRELSIRAQLARRLRGFRGRTGRGGSRPQESGRRSQRVIVKTHVARHKPGKARGSLARHAGYLGRDSASADGKAGIFYDASRAGLNGREEVAAWASDRHHFRIIISPERGGDIPDMTAYVREVMRRVEKDLVSAGAIEPGGKLQWVGINHHNTDNPHAHVVLRGRQANGRDLVIPRAYLSHGMRGRASELATELLGERTIEQAQEARLKEVEAERFTSLDRMIERHLEKGRVDLSPAKSIGFGPDDRQWALARLQFLEGIGLAHKDKGAWWSLEDQFGQSLRELGARNDIIQQLYSSLGNEAGRVQRMTAGSEVSAPVAGVVIAKGSADELGDDRFIVVRDSAGQAHYGRVRDTQGYRDLRVGSVAELGAGAHRRREVAEQIAAVAGAQGIYSAQSHEAYLRQSRPNSTDREIASSVRSAASRLAFVAGFEGSGVRALEGGHYTVEVQAFQRFSQRGSSLTDVRVIAEHPLAAQIEARAVTWLDRQTWGNRPDSRTAGHSAIEEAIGQRADWLVRNGYADRAEGEDRTVRLRPDALGRLTAEERAEVAERLAGKYGKPVMELPQGGVVTGKYRGAERLHAGKLAVVVTEENVFVSPVAQTPEVGAGSKVNLRRTSARDATVEPAAEQTKHLDVGLSLDGPGGK
jgi:type IV secretory pathway VirD2 relaxase